MRILAIGDIHGCLTAFDRLLEVVQPTPEDLLVTLGDYVDRGPDSRGVLDRLVQLKRELRLYPLCGNHEQMMQEACVDAGIREGWLGYGGAATLASYTNNGHEAGLESVPKEHWQFIGDTLDWFETDRHFFVHAGAHAD